jgi:hypothetical protein
LPQGFLKKRYRAWDRFDHAVKLLIVELAEHQKFKCIFCSETRNLIIEHDHEPDEGDGEQPTVDNIRGLVCQRCNWHISLYEQNERGEPTGWDHVDCFIQSHDYDDYIYAYDSRIRSVYEARLEKRCPNYWRRRIVLDKFNDWKEGWNRNYPWRWRFEEIKERRHGKIRTPMQFVRSLTACLKFVAAEREKDPNFQPPESFIKMVLKIKPLLDEMRPTIEARLKALGYNPAELRSHATSVGLI